MENYVNAIKRHPWLIILGYSLLMSVILYVAEEELVYQGLEEFRLPRNSFGMDGLSGHSPVHTLINYYNPVNLVYYFLIGYFLKTVFNKKSTYGIVGFVLVFQSLLGLFVGAWMGA